MTFANAFCFIAFSRAIDTEFVYFKYYLALCTVLLLCWFLQVYVNNVF